MRLKRLSKVVDQGFLAIATGLRGHREITAPESVFVRILFEPRQGIKVDAGCLKAQLQSRRGRGAIKPDLSRHGPALNI